MRLQAVLRGSRTSVVYSRSKLTSRLARHNKALLTTIQTPVICDLLTPNARGCPASYSLFVDPTKYKKRKKNQMHVRPFHQYASSSFRLPDNGYLNFPNPMKKFYIYEYLSLCCLDFFCQVHGTALSQQPDEEFSTSVGWMVFTHQVEFGVEVKEQGSQLSPWVIRPVVTKPLGLFKRQHQRITSAMILNPELVYFA